MSRHHDSQDEFGGMLKTLQVIWGALVSGVVLFLGITLFYRSAEGELFVPQPLWNYSAVLIFCGVLAALLCLLLYFTIPALVVNSQRQALASGRIDQILKGAGGPGTETQALASIAQTQTIIGLALLEGPAFANGIIYMLKGSPVSLAVSVVLVILMAARRPTRSWLEAWITHQRELLRDEQDRLYSA